MGCRILHMAKDGSLYLGDMKNVWRYTDSLRLFFSVDNDRVKSIASLNNGGVVIGLANQGIRIITPDESYSMDINNGLSSNFVNCLAVHQNVIWAGTSKGLNKIILSEAGKPLDVRILTASHGISSDYINSILIKDSDLLIAASATLNIMPLDIPIPSRAPSILISEIRLNGKKVAQEELSKLNGDNISLTLTYNAIYFGPYNRLRYAYRFKDEDSTWQFTNSTSLSFPHLPYGQSQLEIKAETNNNNISSAVIVLPIYIAPPFWHNSWFWLILALLVLVLFTWTMKLIKRKIKKKYEDQLKVEKEINTLKLEAMKAKSQSTLHLQRIELYSRLCIVQSGDRSNDLSGRICRIGSQNPGTF